MIRHRYITTLLFATVACIGTTGSPVFGQVTRASTDYELSKRLDAQAAEIEQLRRQLDEQASLYRFAPDTSDCDGGPNLRRLPVVAEDCWQPSCCDEGDGPQSHTLKYFADYDKGFVIRPFCPEKTPFELKVNGWIQFRHHAFARGVDSWTNNAGVTTPVRNRNAFDIERGRLIFSGFAIDKRLTYCLQIDGDTDGRHGVDFFDYWWAWKFSDRFRLQMGKRKVPGSRQWLMTARRTRFVDRPMANDFFRPSRTVGIFGSGRVGDNGHYEVMVGNGYNTTNIPNSSTDSRLTFAVDNYWDPRGDYGKSIVDSDSTGDPKIRVGHSFVYSPNAANPNGAPSPESAFLRLTDGTRLTEAGALAPGVTVSDFDIFFYGVDAAVKWRGWSANGEVFMRWIEQLQGNGALPVNNLYQHGFYAEGGRFIIPQKLDVNFRYSQVAGLYGNRSEYAGGVNWYPLDTQKMKISFDVTRLDGSPLHNSSSDILVGDNGTLFRTQFQAEF